MSNFQCQPYNLACGLSQLTITPTKHLVVAICVGISRDIGVLASRDHVFRIQLSRTDFNLSVLALPGAIFSYSNADLDTSVSWMPHPDLLEGIRNRVVEAVSRLPRKWLLLLIDGEVFDTLTAAEDRLQGHSLAAKFQVVIGQGLTKERRNFWYIYYGDKIQNDRGFLVTVERDPNNEKIIIISRKRDNPYTWARRCYWLCRGATSNRLDTRRSCLGIINLTRSKIDL